MRAHDSLPHAHRILGSGLGVKHRTGNGRPRHTRDVAAVALGELYAVECTVPFDSRPWPPRSSGVPSLARAPPHPLVIAHRGASCHRPEHTLAAYALAIEMGADFIEPDLVSTKDGVLVAQHENEIGGTTDVAVKFPERRTTKTIDGSTVTGWFTEDFTLAELRTLRAKERLPSRSHAYDGQFGVPTFDDVLALVDSAGRRRDRAVGVYPETNRTQTTARLIQLVSSPRQVTPEGLKDIATYADGIGVNTRMLVPAAPGAPSTSVVRDAHAAGLFVHAWTLRPEPAALAARYQGDPLAEVRELAALGVDGLFGDCPDQLVKALSPR